MSEFTDEELMIDAARRHVRDRRPCTGMNIAVRFVARVWSHSSSVISSSVSWLIWNAALFTRTSTLPNSSTALGMIVLRAPGRRCRRATSTHLPPGLLDELRGVLRVLVLVEVGDQDVGALAGEGDGHGPADAAVAAGDRPRPCRSASPSPGSSPRRGRASGSISPSTPGGSCCWAGWDSGRGSDTGPPAVGRAGDVAAAYPRRRRRNRTASRGKRTRRQARCSPR